MRRLSPTCSRARRWSSSRRFTRNNIGDNNNLGDEGSSLPQIGDRLASAFAGGAFRALESLSIANNQIGNAGVAALATAFEKGALPQLKALRLWRNEIGDEGMKALMAAAGGGGLVTLETLDVEFNDLSAEAMEALAEAIENGKLPSLRDLRRRQLGQQLGLQQPRASHGSGRRARSTELGSDELVRRTNSQIKCPDGAKVPS